MVTNGQPISENLLTAPSGSTPNERRSSERRSSERRSSERRSFLNILWGILVRPRRTWPYLSEHDRQGWWILMVLLLTLTLIPAAISWTYEKRAQTNIVQPSMPYERFGYVEQPVTPSGGVNPAGLILHLFGRGAGTVINWLLWATALYLVSVFWGRSSKFGRMFRLTLWTWVPYAIRGVLQIGFLLIGKSPIWNPGLSGFVIDRSTSGTTLIPPGVGQVALASVLGHIDLFLVWNLFLLIGGLIAFTNLRNKRAVWAVILIWAVLVGLGVIPAIIGSNLSRIGQI